jgi:phage-related protein
LYGVSHPVSAFCFDRAVFTFGTALEDDLNKVSAKCKKEDQAKRVRATRLNKWLNAENSVKGRFREPPPM